MAYVKTTWQNSPSTNTPINATNLNHIEQGIYEAAATADQAESGVEALDPRMDLVEQRLDNLIPEGTPTQGNAELIDIRVGANGITYPDAGSAVRGQVTEIKSALNTMGIIYIRGVGTKSGGNSGVTADGQYFVHSTDRELRIVSNFVSATNFTDTKVNFLTSLLYYYDGNMYKYSGNNNFDGLVRVDKDFVIKSTQVYDIRGVGLRANGTTGVSGVGQFYVHKNERTLKRILTYTSATNFTDETIPFSISALYLYNGEHYVYSGSNNFDGLIRTDYNLENLEDSVSNQISVQLSNIVSSIGISSFEGKKETISEPYKYTAWPFVAPLGNRVYCLYSRGTGHTDNVTPSIYMKSSLDGVSWTMEKQIINTDGIRDTITGIGNDADGNIVFWDRVGAPDGVSEVFKFYKTTDGKTFTLVSTPTFDVNPSHIGDIIYAEGYGLISFWNKTGSGSTRSYGMLISDDGGSTWTQLTFGSAMDSTTCPSEISPVYLGSGKIIAMGRRDGYVQISDNKMYQIQVSYSNSEWSYTLSNTNISDISLSTPSLLYDPSDNSLALYYYDRSTGNLRVRKALVSTVDGNPTEWPDSSVVITDGTGQDSGNVNATSFNEYQIVAYYSGDSTNTGVYSVIQNVT